MLYSIFYTITRYSFFFSGNIRKQKYFRLEKTIIVRVWNLYNILYVRVYLRGSTVWSCLPPYFYARQKINFKIYSILYIISKGVKDALFRFVVLLFWKHFNTILTISICCAKSWLELPVMLSAKGKWSVMSRLCNSIPYMRLFNCTYTIFYLNCFFIVFLAGPMIFLKFLVLLNEKLLWGFYESPFLWK